MYTHYVYVYMLYIVTYMTYTTYTTYTTNITYQLWVNHRKRCVWNTKECLEPKVIWFRFRPGR